MKKVLIFGSTGSVGKEALKIIRKNRTKFKVLGLCANKDTKTIISQAEEFSPSYICVRNELQADKISKKLSKKVKLLKGKEGLDDFAAINCDLSLMAISGIACLRPLSINIAHAKRIALANKESLVVAGSLILDKAKKFNTEILPVDSEINAIFQIIQDSKYISNNKAEIKKIYLTASGGALFGYKKEDLQKVKVENVLNHPTWKMGRRITVDSATLVNKGFEVIETHYFFDVPYEKIDIVIHKESLTHALVELKDSSLFSCIYLPSMKVPIDFAFSYPRRSASEKGIDFKRKKFTFSFLPIVYKDYPLLKIILQAAEIGGNSLAIMNACDEVAVEWFLHRKIKFTDIHKVMKYIFKHYPKKGIKNLDDIFYWDNWARKKTEEYLNKI